MVVNSVFRGKCRLVALIIGVLCLVRGWQSSIALNNGYKQDMQRDDNGLYIKDALHPQLGLIWNFSDPTL